MKFKSKWRKVLGIIPSRHKTITWIKKELSYVCKRGSSKSHMSKSSKMKYSQLIFGIRMWSIIENNYYIVNVDEAMFTKSVKQNYSWLTCGKRHPIVNQNWVWSSTVIHGRWLGGDWLWAIYQGSTTSHRFDLYLLILREYWTKALKIDQCRIKIIWDNASVHVSKKTLKMAVFLGISIYWLPQYSLSLPPVESVFEAMK